MKRQKMKLNNKCDKESIEIVIKKIIYIKNINILKVTHYFILWNNVLSK